MRILLVEDNESLAQGLQQALRHSGFVVNHVDTAKAALQAFQADLPDILVLDLGLPDMDGLEVLRQLRRTSTDLPVLLLTARNTLEDKVSGLDCGADDYLAKPFDMEELLARLRALERRISSATSSSIEIAGVALDSRSLAVTVDEKPVALQRREYMLLKALMENAGRVMTRNHLETSLYSWGEEIASNAIEVHIHHLRKQLPSGFIKTVRGIGYTVEQT